MLFFLYLVLLGLHNDLTECDCFTLLYHAFHEYGGGIIETFECFLLSPEGSSPGLGLVGPGLGLTIMALTTTLRFSIKICKICYLFS